MLVVMLLLTALGTVSPAFHHWLHADGDVHHADGCAIVLFASGVTLVATTVPSVPPQPGVCVVQRLAEEPQLTPRPHLHPPGNGPPVV